MAPYLLDCMATVRQIASGRKVAAWVGRKRILNLVGSKEVQSQNGKPWNNLEIAKGKHLKHIFQRAPAVADMDKGFFDRVCKRSMDAVTYHPVLVVGEWRQGKSSTINSLIGQTEGQGEMKMAMTGRHLRQTSEVSIYPVRSKEGLGSILLADTPGLEPDKSERYDIMNGYRIALEARGLSPNVGTDLVLVVIAATPQSISNMTSTHLMDFILENYERARGDSRASLCILPVLTHADKCEPEEIKDDKSFVYGELNKALHHRKVAKGRQTLQSCSSSTRKVLDPIAICNGSEKRKPMGIEELKRRIEEVVEERTKDPDFRHQWASMQVEDLLKNVKTFHLDNPHEAAESRLFHCTVQGVLATYQKECDWRTLEREFAEEKPNWEIIHELNRKLRGQLSEREKWSDWCLQQAPLWVLEGWQKYPISSSIILTMTMFLTQVFFARKKFQVKVEASTVERKLALTASPSQGGN